MTVSGADSVRVRVHQYERGFRRKPDRRVPADELRAGLSRDTGRDTPRCHGRSAVPPDDSDMRLGVSDPLFFRRGTSAGGWQRGSPHAPVPHSLLQTAALTATRAAQSAARCPAAKSLKRKDIS